MDNVCYNSVMKKINLPPKKCPYCKKLFYRGKSNISDFREKKYCSRDCYWKAKDKNSFRLNNEGYLRNHKDQYLHRLVMEKHLKRKLKKNEHIHHKDGNKLNNRISNLELHTNSNHRKEHNKNAKRDKKGRFCA